MVKERQGNASSLVVLFVRFSLSYCKLPVSWPFSLPRPQIKDSPRAGGVLLSGYHFNDLSIVWVFTGKNPNLPAIFEESVNKPGLATLKR